jgi:hypothetical protein
VWINGLPDGLPALVELRQHMPVVSYPLLRRRRREMKR